ncbi:MAG: enamine deaminase RidA (YjgF/YER057c/UK114 family) [Halioglobus sp.]|jgi:enamine deaminase RidA (YjgF/YER057c/UK114 family)
MTKQSLQPADLFSSADFGFAQAVSVEGKRLIFCAGQTAWDKDNNIIGGDDLGQQMAKTLENVGFAVAAAGATLADVCRLTIYIVDYNPGMLDTIAAELNKVFDKESLPANSLIGIQALAVPEFLVEIEATAVVDH